ncbi:MAG TPA: FkbM family methyltransferase [Rhizomicrobium sp.]
MNRGPAEYLLGANRYGKYCVPPASEHRRAVAAILAGKVYERRTIRFMIEHCAAGDIVHAGTYFGDFLPALSVALHPQALIWAFEPNCENFCCAKNTIEMNGLENVRLMNAGLGAKPDTMLLQVRDADGALRGGSSRLVRTREPGAEHEEVRIVAVDDIIPADRAISILQLDVEDFEQEALTGALSTVRRCLPVMILENLPRDEAWFQQNILSLGYAFRGKVHANSIFAPIGIPLALPGH